MQTTMSLRLSEELAAKLGELAQAMGRTKSFVAVRALEDFVAREAWQVAEIQQGIREAEAGDFATDEDMRALEAKWSPGAR
ncbi:CopG family ribbon-helix-helix protein [Desulfolutivibrio sulfodismutans]|nr:CopG family ribbon-helix-helix protein [Desulfolutivibrio sulfodismutans]